MSGGISSGRPPDNPPYTIKPEAGMGVEPLVPYSALNTSTTKSLLKLKWIPDTAYCNKYRPLIEEVITQALTGKEPAEHTDSSGQGVAVIFYECNCEKERAPALTACGVITITANGSSTVITTYGLTMYSLLKYWPRSGGLGKGRVYLI